MVYFIRKPYSTLLISFIPIFLLRSHRKSNKIYHCFNCSVSWQAVINCFTDYRNIPKVVGCLIEQGDFSLKLVFFVKVF